MEQFSSSLSLRVSDNVRVPVAIGFFVPAVIVPKWFLEEMSPQELKHVILHEVEHLRRRDDWTNLAQKIAKALLFFHPSMWWIEQQLSLEREIACDDAVLAHARSPQDYAQCLKRVAEKSFLRRKVALAQAVITRMHQLSLRMARILDVNRPGSTRIWKPAVPIVLAIALACGFSAGIAPELVSFTADAPETNAVAPAMDNSPSPAARARGSGTPQAKLVLANAPLKALPVNHLPVKPALHKKAARPMQAKIFPYGDYVIQSEQVIVTVTSRVNTAGQPIWLVHMWQVRVLVPATNSLDKTISPKNI